MNSPSRDELEKLCLENGIDIGEAMDFSSHAKVLPWFDIEKFAQLLLQREGGKPLFYAVVDANNYIQHIGQDKFTCERYLEDVIRIGCKSSRLIELFTQQRTAPGGEVVYQVRAGESDNWYQTSEETFSKFPSVNRRLLHVAATSSAKEQSQ